MLHRLRQHNIEKLDSLQSSVFCRLENSKKALVERDFGTFSIEICSNEVEQKAIIRLHNLSFKKDVSPSNGSKLRQQTKIHCYCIMK